MTHAEARIWSFFSWHTPRLRFWLIAWSLLGLAVAAGAAPPFNIYLYALCTAPVWIAALCLHSFGDWRLQLARLLFFWCLVLPVPDFGEASFYPVEVELWIARLLPDFGVSYYYAVKFLITGSDNHPNEKWR